MADAADEKAAAQGVVSPRLGRYLIVMFLADFVLACVGISIAGPVGFALLATAAALPIIGGRVLYGSGSVGPEFEPESRYFSGRGFESIVLGGGLWALASAGALLLPRPLTSSLLGIAILGLVLGGLMFMGFGVPAGVARSEVFLGPTTVTIFEGGRLDFRARWQDLEKVYLYPGSKNTSSSVTFVASKENSGTVSEDEDVSGKTFETFVRALRIELAQRPSVPVEDRIKYIRDVTPSEVAKPARPER